MPPEFSAKTERMLPERFASVVAHEMRNPLSAVRIALQTVGHGETVSKKDMRRLNIALREVGTLERILDLMLEWARPSAHDAVDVAAQALVEEARTLAQDALEEMNVRLQVSGAPLVLHVDPRKVAGALSELISNGALASAHDALLSLTFDETPLGVEFRVSNDGASVDATTLAHAFDPFWSGRQRGVGLGLTVARGVAEQLGGTIALEARADGGCAARLILPAAVLR